MPRLFRFMLTIVPLLVAVLWYFARRNTEGAIPSRSPLPSDTEAVLYGGNLIVDGVRYYADWSAAMRREYGREIDSQLEDWYELAHHLSGRPADEWRTIVIRRLTANGKNLASRP